MADAIANELISQYHFSQGGSFITLEPLLINRSYIHALYQFNQQIKYMLYYISDLEDYLDELYMYMYHLHMMMEYLPNDESDAVCNYLECLKSIYPTFMKCIRTIEFNMMKFINNELLLFIEIKSTI